MCVQRCSDFPGYIQIVNRCFFTNASDASHIDSKAAFHEISQDLLNSWLPILIACIVAVIFSYVLLVLFRYAIKYVIWIIYIGLIVLLVIGAIVFLVFYFVANKDDKNDQNPPVAFLATSGVLTLLAVILGFVIFFFRKRIALVIQIFKEASKALGDVPLIVVEPFLTFLAFILSTAAFLYFQIVIQSSGNLEIQNDNKGNFSKATYERNFGMNVAYYVNIVSFIWFTQFILGCQHFVIAGTVCQWFFARTKDKLDSPIRRSFHYLLSMHIGSICLGSIFITIVKIIRMLVHGVKVRKESYIAYCIYFDVDISLEFHEKLG